MDADKHHMELVDGLYRQLEGIFQESRQGVYLYLDDNHRVCNKKFASLLGYHSPKEWARIKGSLLDETVAETSRDTLVSAYQQATERFVASTINVTWKNKNGGEVKTTVILVPIIYDEHQFALHFVSQ